MSLSSQKVPRLTKRAFGILKTIANDVDRRTELPPTDHHAATELQRHGLAIIHGNGGAILISSTPEGRRTFVRLVQRRRIG